jgi:multimeric flavodoxin WrbA
MMNILAVVGSPRKSKATDILVDKAIEGAQSKEQHCYVKKINLIDYDINYCKNCLACRDSKTVEPFAKCSIRDDMDQISVDVLNSDALIFGTSVQDLQQQ